MSCVKKIYQSGANEQNRTADLILTKDVLYRLSYIGIVKSPNQAKFPLPTNNPAFRAAMTFTPTVLELFYFDIIRSFQKKLFPEKKRQIEYSISTPFVNRH